MNAKDLARTALQNSRYRRNFRSRETQSKMDSRNQFVGVYGGYQDGQHQVKLPNGAKVPVKWQSTGGIELGQPMIISVATKSATAYARVMPRS